MKIPYSLYSGAGNLFILIDNRQRALPEMTPALISALCRHPEKWVADGVISLEPSSLGDFSMRIFNIDGSEADMCGNGLRTAVKFMNELGVKKPSFAIETKATKTMGLFFGSLLGDEVKVQMARPHSFTWDIPLDLLGEKWPLHFLNTGVPHAVSFVPSVESIDVLSCGKVIRHHPFFSPEGTNVTFAQILRSNLISIRTFERGVEGETMACGTGAVAAALAANRIKGLPSPIRLLLHSKEEMSVSFVESQGAYEQVYLQGSAKKIGAGFF